MIEFLTPPQFRHLRQFRHLLILISVTFAAAVSPAAQAVPPSASARITYHAEPLAAGELPKKFSLVQLGVLEKLNRRDLEHLARLTEIIAPDTWPEDELAYSPLPADWPWALAMPKALIVHQPAQVFGAYEYGRLVRWGPVSTGRKETPTPAGSYNLTWKSKSRTSTDNDAWLLKWYFNFINSRGVSFHQFDLPGYAASHACVRLLQRDAQWLYGWGDQWKLSADKRSVDVPGTPVLVVGDFPHGGVPPWTSLQALSTPIELPANVPLPVVAAR